MKHVINTLICVALICIAASAVSATYKNIIIAKSISMECPEEPEDE